MTHQVDPAKLKRTILTAVQGLLKPLGYRQSSSLFVREIGDVVHLIEVQGSQSNTRAQARFTANVGVFAPALVYADVREARPPSIPLCHWRQRIGALSPEKSDLWWRVSSLRDAEIAGAELVHRQREHALPRLSQLATLAALADLWKAGRSPGLTEQERNELVTRLTNGT